jgi:hypothetical protein
VLKKETDGPVHNLPIAPWSPPAEWTNLELELTTTSNRITFAGVAASIPAWRRRVFESRSAMPRVRSRYSGLADPTVALAAASLRDTRDLQPQPLLGRFVTPASRGPRVEVAARIVFAGTARAWDAVRGTSVSGLAAASGAPRLPAPRRATRGVELPPIELHRVLSAEARREPRRVLSSIIRHQTASALERAALDRLSFQMRGGGAHLCAGDTQILQFEGRGLPEDTPEVRLVLDGVQAVRVVFLSFSGRPLADIECEPGHHSLIVPTRTHRAVLFGIGILRPARTQVTQPAGSDAMRPEVERRPLRRPVPSRIAASVPQPALRTPLHGSISGTQARAPQAAVGVESDSWLLRLSPRTFLGRGVVLEIEEGSFPRATLDSALPAPSVLSGLRELNVWLPGRPGTLIVIVRPPANGSETVAECVHVAGPTGVDFDAPRAVLGDRVVALLFPVAVSGTWRTSLRLEHGYRLEGVVQADGSPVSWANELVDRQDWNLVDDGPLCLKGETLFRMEGVT